MPSCGVEARKFAMCMAQLLSPADMVDVGAGLTHEEEGDLFSIVTSARKYEAVGAISSSSSRKQKLLFFDAVLCCLDGMGVKKAR